MNLLRLRGRAVTMPGTMSKKKPRGRPKESDVPKAVLHIEVPVPLKQRFKAVADANSRKITAEAILALQAHVERWEKERREQKPPA